MPEPTEEAPESTPEPVEPVATSDDTPATTRPARKQSRPSSKRTSSAKATSEPPATPDGAQDTDPEVSQQVAPDAEVPAAGAGPDTVPLPVETRPVPPGPPTTPTPTAPAAAPSSRGRSVMAVVCLVLAAVMTVPAGIAYWGQRTINDGQRYVDTVGPLVDSPEVQAAIATKVTDAIEKQVDVEAVLNQVFAGVITDRPRLQALVGPLAGAINGLIERQVQEFIASDAFADFWVAANVRLQEALIRVLDGESTGAISIQGDQVVLDVSDVIEQVKQRLVDRGLTILNNVPVPDTDRQIVLLQSDELKQARTIYAFTNPVARWLFPIVGLLYLGALLLSRRRPRMAVIIGGVIALNALLLAWALSVGQHLFTNQLSGTVFAPAARVFYDQLLSYLERGQTVLLWLGLTLAVIGWYAGRNASGTAARNAVSGVLENIGGAMAHGPVGSAGRWVAPNAVWLRIAVGVLGVVVLLWGNDVSEARYAWTLVLVALLLMVVQVLVGAGGGGRERDAVTDAGATPVTG